MAESTVVNDGYAPPTSLGATDGVGVANWIGVRADGSMDHPRLAFTSPYRTHQIQWRVRGRMEVARALALDGTGADHWEDWQPWTGGDVAANAATPCERPPGKPYHVMTAPLEFGAVSLDMALYDRLELQMRVRVFDEVSSPHRVSEWAYASLRVVHVPAVEYSLAFDGSGFRLHYSTTDWARDGNRLHLYKTVGPTRTRGWLGLPQEGSVPVPDEFLVGGQLDARIAFYTCDLGESSQTVSLLPAAHPEPAGVPEPTVTVDASGVHVSAPAGQVWDAVSAWVSYDDALTGEARTVDAAMAADGSASSWSSASTAVPCDVPITVRAACTANGDYVVRERRFDAGVPSLGAWTWDAPGVAQVRLRYNVEPRFDAAPVGDSYRTAGRTSPVSRHGTGRTVTGQVHGQAAAADKGSGWLADYSRLRQGRDWTMRGPHGVLMRVRVTSVSTALSGVGTADVTVGFEEVG